MAILGRNKTARDKTMLTCRYRPRRCLRPRLRLMRYTRPCSTVALSPSWMGNTGFQDDHAALWQRAENQFDIKNVPPKLRRTPTATLSLLTSIRNLSLRRISKANFWAVKRDCLQERRRWHWLLPRCPFAACPYRHSSFYRSTSSMLFLLPYLPPAPEPDQMQVDQGSTRRASRKRNPDGTRARYQSRKQRAIANLPLQVETVIAKGSPLTHY